MVLKNAGWIAGERAVILEQVRVKNQYEWINSVLPQMWPQQVEA